MPAPPRPRTPASRLAQVRARLDLPTVKRAAGRLDGRHRSIFTGHGQDFDDQVEYRPGDDVKDIDWKSSARAGRPIIRRFVRESDLTVVLAVDTGRTMAATAPSGVPKAQVAMFAADVVAYLARSRGDQVALVAGDAERLDQVPARSGTAHLEMMLRRLAAQLSGPGPAEPGGRGPTTGPATAPASTTARGAGTVPGRAPASDLGLVLDRVLGWARRRSLVVVITDEARPRPEHEGALRRLRTRHDVLVIAVADAMPTRPGIGPTDDVDGGPVLPAFLRDDPVVHAEAAAVAERRRDDVRAMLLRRGVEHVVVQGEDDLVDALAELFERLRRARR
ncbi:DUF58 domain-containing protein [Georgenia sp. 10Sc9-8]|uniref:DUF58 domain-containing protein n=1 Tax=Georgenia halotolerans TaxID=3028317 RepID=A0ABT5TV08_9MICO|nr:DUF58 domain-containing protein [Georgenia halotolerans]